MTMKRVLGTLLVGLILATAPVAAWADSDVIVGGVVIPTDPNASGTKVTGVITIYFEQTASETPPSPPCGIAEVNMFFVLKLKKGTNLYSFAGQLLSADVSGGLCFSEDQASQFAAIRAFLGGTALRAIFDRPSAVPVCSDTSSVPCYAIKSVENIIQNGDFQQPPPYFATADIDLAVKQQ